MADAVLVVSWKTVTRGREQHAFQLFGEIVLYFTKVQQEALIESFEPVLLEPRDEGLMGLVLLRGEVEKLDELRRKEDFQRLVARASLIVDGLSLTGGRIGPGLAVLIGLYQEAVQGIS